MRTSIGGADLEPLCDLLFELSNDDRLKILLELEEAPMNLSGLARRLDFTAQGTSRNVARLAHVNLLERNPEGDYQLTSYGETSLKLLASYDFLSREKVYILSHTTRWLPHQFVSRLGELRVNERVTELLDAVGNIARERRAAGEYEWFISPGRMSSPRDAADAVNALKRGVKIRAIEPMYYTPSESVMKETSREILDFFEDSWRRGDIQVRHVDEIKIRLYMTEKAVSLLALPKRGGEVDVLGYSSRDPLFRGWCRDLFEYYWAGAKQVEWFWTQGRPSHT